MIDSRFKSLELIFWIEKHDFKQKFLIFRELIFSKQVFDVQVVEIVDDL
jgi:hypothetical protein